MMGNEHRYPLVLREWGGGATHYTVKTLFKMFIQPGLLYELIWYCLVHGIYCQKSLNILFSQNPQSPTTKITY